MRLLLQLAGIGDALVGLLGNKYNIYITGYVPCIWYWFGFRVAQDQYCCRHDFHGIISNDCTSYRMPSSMDCTCMSLRGIQLDMSMIPVFGLQ